MRKSSMAKPIASSAPKLPARTTGLSPKEQKLQALREKLAQASSGSKPGTATSSAPTPGFKAKNSFAGKKTAFQRKAT
jgi:hypothetical protein